MPEQVNHIAEHDEVVSLPDNAIGCDVSPYQSNSHEALHTTPLRCHPSGVYFDALTTGYVPAPVLLLGMVVHMANAIPIKASFTEREELANLLSALEEETSGIRVARSSETSGLAMDPATVALIFEAVKVVVPILVTTLANIWVEHIKSVKPPRSGRQGTEPKPRIILETDSGDIRIILDTSDVEASIGKASLPETVEQVTRIRLES